MEDRDMTYGELAGLFERLESLGLLKEDDVVAWFVQAPGAGFACPFLYAVVAARAAEMVSGFMPGVPREEIDAFLKACSAGEMASRIRSGRFGGLDEEIGLLDFKDESKPDGEKFGGLMTQFGAVYNEMRKKGAVGEIDSVEEKDTSVFGFKVFDGRWIPLVAKTPEGDARTVKVPPGLQAKLGVLAGQIRSGEMMRTQLSAMDPEVVEFLEIVKNRHLYDGEDAIS